VGAVAMLQSTQGDIGTGEAMKEGRTRSCLALAWPLWLPLLFMKVKNQSWPSFLCCQGEGKAQKRFILQVESREVGGGGFLILLSHWLVRSLDDARRTTGLRHPCLRVSRRAGAGEHGIHVLAPPEIRRTPPSSAA
jgi:hypothetical protein